MFIYIEELQCSVKEVLLIFTQGTNVIVFINKDCPCVKGHQLYFKDLEKNLE